MPGLSNLLSAALGMAVAFGGTVVGAVEEGTQPLEAERPKATEAALASAKSHAPILRAFLQAMPKGGDIHYHLTGGIYAEHLLDWAAEDSLCVETETWAILPDRASPQCPEPMRQVPAEKVRANEGQASTLIDSLSIRTVAGRDPLAVHKQFFSTFSRITYAPKRLGDALAAAAGRAANQNISYLEMMNPMGADLQSWAASVSDARTLQAIYADLMAAGFNERLSQTKARAMAEIEAALARKDELLACGSADPKPGCEVVVRLQYLGLRTLPAQSSVFAGLALGYALTEESSSPFVGINIAGPEDAPVARKYYDLHMQMLDFLWQRHGPRKISLHAGELTLDMAPPVDMRDHIRKAVFQGHASRIGHGVSIAHEIEPIGLLSEFREADILVEINLSSNALLLGVEGPSHPFDLYRRFGVPTTLATDDEGVFRIDLTHEYRRAVETYDLSYRDLKELAKNSIRYSFLPSDQKAALLADLKKRFRSFEEHVTRGAFSRVRSK